MIEIDSQKKRSKFWLLRMREKQKKTYYVRLVEKYPFFLAKLNFSHSYAN